jgi:predicted ATPase/class 3 adenylate cyclase
MDPARLPTGTVTFLFTDIEGSTRLVQDPTVDYLAVLEDHDRLVRESMGGGVEVSTEGDAFFYVFDSATRAVSAAVSTQRALAEHAWPHASPVRVRMGLHTGEGIVGRDDYVGIDVHRASRIASAGHGGQVLLSETTRALVATDLPAGVELVELGEQHLKDLLQPETLHQLRIPGLVSDFPPIRASGTISNAIPGSPNSFIGRESELEALHALISTTGLVTVVGPGGAGKSRITLEAGRNPIGFPGGAAFVDLTAVSNPALVASHVASSLALTESATRPSDEIVAMALGDLRSLLILDNCEHLVDEVARFTSSLLGRCPRLTVLATSREPLGIAAERILRLSGLTLPAEDTSVENGLGADSALLFVERAEAVGVGFDVAQWGSQCIEICRRLDGVPLAIELAAARTNALSPQEILDRLDDRFALLRSRSRSATGRHETLEAAIDWSYDGLAEAEKAVLRRAAAFRGGFTLDAAEEACAGPGVESGDVLDVLSSLIDKSLVTSTMTTEGARYRLLETIREYAARRLAEADETGSAHSRHADWYLGWARRQAGLLQSGADQLTALARLEADHQNLRAVIERSIRSGDRDAALQMAGSLTWFWYVHAHFTECDHWSKALLTDPVEPPTHPWVRLLIGAGEIDFRLGQLDRSDARLEQALRAARRLGSKSLEMWALAYRATNEMGRLDLPAAADALAESLQMAHESDNPLGIGYLTMVRILMGMGSPGWATSQQRDPAVARELLEELNLLVGGVRQSGERNMIGHCLQYAGTLAYWGGDPAIAVGHLDESIVAFEELETVSCACHCLESIAEVILPTGQVTSAARLLAAAESLRADVGVIAPPIEEMFRNQTLEALRSSIEPADFSAAWATGHDLTLPEAVAIARESLARST